VRSVTWTVAAPAPRTAQNVILFIGDGMSYPIISASRLVSRGQTGGYLNGKLNMQTLPVAGMLSTSGADSIMTDSANSAAAYSMGTKSFMNALGVTGDSDQQAVPTSGVDNYNDARVELITERIRRDIPGMAIGVVTTAEIQDATPAAWWAHTRRRGDKVQITDQLLRGIGGFPGVQPDVVLGGGGRYFNGSDANAIGAGAYPGRPAGFVGANLWAEAAAAGYTTVFDRASMKAKTYEADKLLGIFHKGNMDVWVDRHQMTWNLDPANWPVPTVPGQPKFNVTDQPDLLEMTETAISLLSRKGGKNGFFLMVEGASVDKQEHTTDFDRAMGELIDMDNAIGAAIAFTKTPAGANTLVIVTADHAQGYDAWGTVDTLVFNSPNPADGSAIPDASYAAAEAVKASAIGTYQSSGWPTYVDANGDRFPDSWAPRVTLAQGKMDHLADFREDYQPSLTPRNPLLVPNAGAIYGPGGPGVGPTGDALGTAASAATLAAGASVGKTVANQFTNGAASSSLSDDLNGLRLQGFLQYGQTGGQTAHTLSDVPVFAGGPGSQLIKPSMDNTDIHYVMAAALGLGSAVARYPAVAGAAVGADVTCSNVVPSVVNHATLGLLTTSCATGATYCDPTRPYVVGGATYYPMLGSLASLNMKATTTTCPAN